MWLQFDSNLQPCINLHVFGSWDVCCWCLAKVKLPRLDSFQVDAALYWSILHDNTGEFVNCTWLKSNQFLPGPLLYQWAAGIGIKVVGLNWNDCKSSQTEFILLSTHKPNICTCSLWQGFGFQSCHFCWKSNVTDWTFTGWLTFIYT